MAPLLLLLAEFACLAQCIYDLFSVDQLKGTRFCGLSFCRANINAQKQTSKEDDL